MMLQNWAHGAKKNYTVIVQMDKSSVIAAMKISYRVTEAKGKLCLMVDVIKKFYNSNIFGILQSSNPRLKNNSEYLKYAYKSLYF